MSSSTAPRKPLLLSTPIVWAGFFWVSAVLRFLCVPPFVIDDDEAWWSAASLAMKSPWDFYRSAVDHKPPGIVWFYWFVDHLVPSASDPRVIRAAYTVLSILAAGVLGWMAARFAEKKGGSAFIEGNATEITGWCAATLFLWISAIPTPKLLSVTADGVLIDLVIFGYALALFMEFPGVCLVSGMLLGASLLIKQTAVFFALPILLASIPRKWSWPQIAMFALGSALVVVPTMIAVDFHEFIYWTWTYPSQVLVPVRERLFDSTSQMVSTIVIFVLATLPVLWMVLSRAWKDGRTEGFKSLREFRILWLISGILAAFMGKGLFLHYTLLFAAPFALLAADALIQQTNGLRRGVGVFWLGFQYVVCCGILIIPMSGVFWGTDLAYFSELSRVMKGSLSEGERVMIWGGSALPLAYAGAPHVTRFVLPRFAVEPYASERTQEIFHQELAKDPPSLILDLHERGDNQFNNPIQSEPYVAGILKNYRLYVSKTIPWAKFYFLKPPAAQSELLEVHGDEQIGQVYTLFPSRPQSWMAVVGHFKAGDSWARSDRILRMAATVELIGSQSLNATIRDQALALVQKLVVEPPIQGAEEQAEEWIGKELGPLALVPLPLRSIAWWPTVAMVELQPKTFKTDIPTQHR